VHQTEGSNDDDTSTSAPVVAPPRSKHKKLHRAAAAATVESSATVETTPLPLAPITSYRKPINPYAVYRNIKSKVHAEYY